MYINVKYASKIGGVIIPAHLKWLICVCVSDLLTLDWNIWMSVDMPLFEYWFLSNRDHDWTWFQRSIGNRQTARDSWAKSVQSNLCLLKDWIEDLVMTKWMLPNSMDHCSCYQPEAAKLRFHYLGHHDRAGTFLTVALNSIHLLIQLRTL